MLKHGFSRHFVWFVEVPSNHVLVYGRHIWAHTDSVAKFCTRSFPRVGLEWTVIVSSLEIHGLLCVVPTKVEGHRIIDLDGCSIGREPITLQYSTKLITIWIDVTSNKGFGGLLSRDRYRPVLNRGDCSTIPVCKLVCHGMHNRDVRNQFLPAHTVTLNCVLWPYSLYEEVKFSVSGAWTAQKLSLFGTGIQIQGPRSAKKVLLVNTYIVILAVCRTKSV